MMVGRDFWLGTLYLTSSFHLLFQVNKKWINFVIFWYYNRNYCHWGSHNLQFSSKIIAKIIIPLCRQRVKLQKKMILTKGLSYKSFAKDIYLSRRVLWWCSNSRRTFFLSWLLYLSCVWRFVFNLLLVFFSNEIYGFIQNSLLNAMKNWNEPWKRLHEKKKIGDAELPDEVEIYLNSVTGIRNQEQKKDDKNCPWFFEITSLTLTWIYTLLCQKNIVIFSIFQP